MKLSFLFTVLVPLLISLPTLACKDFSGSYLSKDLDPEYETLIKIEQKACDEFVIQVIGTYYNIVRDRYHVRPDGIPYDTSFTSGFGTIPFIALDGRSTSQRRARFEGENLVIGDLHDWRKNEPNVKKCKEVLSPNKPCTYYELVFKKESEGLELTSKGNRWYCDDENNCTHVPLIDSFNKIR